jgi:outer membrane protein assembly factor BamB
MGLLSALAAGCSPTPSPTGPATAGGDTPAGSTAQSSTPMPSTPSPTASPVPLPGQAAGLPPAPPGVPFTGRLLIADRGNDRILTIAADGTVTWTFPVPGRPLPVPFGAPDDAFLTPDGRTVVANAEGSQTVTAIAVASASVLWQVGHHNVRGRAPGYFNEPDDAVPNPDGSVWVADIRNCRLVHLSGSGAWLGTVGSGSCRHAPPASFDMPNGAFPAPDGSMVITEIGGSWVTWLNPDGTVRWSVRSPAAYPSDAVPYPDGSVLLTDYSNPGAVYRIDASGHVLWRYRPTGAGRLDHPSIALPIASNRVAVCDDWDSRILIVDPTTGAVVWTFTGQGSSRLSYPDGLDYLPSA